MNYNNLCYRCFAEKRFAGMPCQRCGHNNASPQISINCMAPGSLLNNRYVVGVAIGAGGFGITYKCFDTVMGGICAIKEYFPMNFANRDSNGKTVYTDSTRSQSYFAVMNRFIEEARLLKGFSHPNIIRVYDDFFENNTAYYVMEYCDGIDLRKYTNNFRNRLTYEDGMNIMYQVIKGLKYIHNEGVLHRDIAPDNIYITKNNTVKILDFGSARHEIDQLNRNLSIIVKAGYAPVEQYGSRDRQGTYTDVYAFGATFYHLFTGIMPVESTQRVADDTLIPFSQLRPDLPVELRNVIERSLCLHKNDRIKDFNEMENMLNISRVPIVQYQEKRPVGTVASISKRLIAYMLDAIIYGVIYSALVYYFAPNEPVAIMIWLMFPIALFIINTITESMSGRTLGKVMTGICVVDRNSTKPKISQILKRNLVKLLGVIALFFSKDGVLLEDRVTTCIVCEV